jgi:putative dimethyl sulfoxide reductase chaperone
METAALADIAQRRSRTYYLLSRLVLEAPSSAFLAELGGALDSAPPDAEMPLGHETMALSTAVSEACADSCVPEALDVERTRLLAGLNRTHGAPPPYESVLRENKLPGEATIAVTAAYAEAGFEPPVPEAGPADHLGAELRFLALLCHRELEAWRGGERATAAAWVERERAFLDDHVLQWVPQHCERLLALAEAPYHRAMLALIARACLIDRDDVEELAAHGATANVD